MPVAEHLVGRAAELAWFDRLLSDLEGGRSATIEIVGEPGIGKTRLLAELGARADERGRLVLSGSASELELDLPFWVFVDALDEYVQGLEPQRLESLAEDVRSELAHVFPSLSALASGNGSALQHERYRSHRAVRDLLELLAAKPLVLVLDDLHWADPASVELLGALLHRPPAAPMLVALAARPRQVPERLAAVLERAIRAGSLERVELSALTPDQAHELHGDAAADIYEASGGNPFYLEQLARSLDRAQPSVAAGSKTTLGGIEVPQSVAAALGEELGLLTDGARRVLEGAAVAGDPFEPELAAAAAGVEHVEAIDAVDELLRVDLIRPTDVPRRFRFRHPLVRRAVYEATPGGWRLAAHERCAEALAAMGVSARSRAHHVEQSARPGDLAAVAVLREAGEATQHRAPASAERWFSAALRLLPEAAAEERVELLLARSGALAATGRFADSHAVLLESTAIAPEDAVGLRVRLVAATASVEHLLGRHQQAHARLEAALAELPDSASPEAIALMLELAVDGLYRGAYDDIGGWAERAVASATPRGDRSLLAAALAVRALGSALSGAVADARVHREDAAGVIDMLSDDEVARRLDALAHLATAEMYLDLFEPSGRHAERAVQLGRATGQGDLFPLIFPMLGTSLWVQGRMAEAAGVFDGAIEHARLLDNSQGLAWNLFNRSFAALAAGDVEVALSTARESMEIAKQLDESIVTGHAAWGFAAALLETGQAAEAADLLLASTGGEELSIIPGGWRANGLWLLVRCLLAAGRREEAERAAAAAAGCAESIGLPMASAMARLAEATLALDCGDGAAAAEGALDAAAALGEVGDAYHAALARMLAGRALAAAGERERAVDELEHAAAAFESFGAPRYRAEAEQELRKLGRTIHRRTAHGTAESGLAALTERELELARLVVERKTNPQIAQELFLSQKTVETHLRNIFRKVGVANRVELARAVEAADRAETLT
jgi:DNA-binding CsgD family transcriptional regulator